MKWEIAEQLLTIGAVALRPTEPFTWSSGLKSPIYCDNRSTIGYPDLRKKIANGLASIIRENFPQVECIAGTATAGIPHAAWVSDILNLPMNYVRGTVKAHGSGRQIEGMVTAGQKMVIVEDLISTGGSSITTAKALKSAGCEVLGVVSIFTYELEQAEQNFATAGLKFISLSDFSTLVERAVEIGFIKQNELQSLMDWKKNPTEWANEFTI
jgi:orotate phosphoribosyltransferase